ncbi:MAG: anti-sigma factor antagonist [Phycisphaerales bacterium]|nr:anti-sigma factor antagonist [Phycisphaerales bacterium]
MENAQSILAASLEGELLVLTVVMPAIDAERAIQLKAEIAHALQTVPGDVRTVRLDVSRVLAMSSRGFESLLQLHRSCRDRGWSLTLSKLTPTFQQLLDRMGFLRLFIVEK